MNREGAEQDGRARLHGGATARTSAADAPTRGKGARLGRGVVDRSTPYAADAVTLERLSDAMDALQVEVRRLTGRHDRPDPQAKQAPKVSGLRGAPRLERNAIPVPPPGDKVPWDAHFRADVPQYVVEQLKTEAYRSRRTAVSVVLQLMSAYRDDDGRPVFRIREEDMIADRRMAERPKSRKHKEEVLPIAKDNKL